MNATSITRSSVCVACLLAVLLVGALGTVACGGSQAASGTPPPAASPSPTASAEAAGPIAAVSYATPPAPPEKAITAGTVGWKFTPRVDIKITALGCYDTDQDGLALPHRVGIFKGHPERLLASVTVHPKSTLDGAFRWESLKAPLVLKAGEAYLVGTADRQQVERFNMESTCETCYQSVGQWAPEIAFGGLRTSYRFGGPAFTAPRIVKQINAFMQIAWMSPNFKFLAASTAAKTTSGTLKKLMSYSYTTPRGPVLATRRSPSFTTHGGRLVVRLLIDRVGNNSMQGWEWEGPGGEASGPVTGFWLVAAGERLDKETAPTAGSLGRTVGTYEGEFLTTDGKRPAPGVYRLHVVTSRIDGTVTVLEER